MPSEGMIQSSLEAPSKNNVEADLLTSPPESIPTGDTYLDALQQVERKSVAALRSVAKKLKKKTEDSIKTIDKYRREIDEAKKIMAKSSLRS